VAGEGGIIHLRDLVADLVGRWHAVEFLVAFVHLGIVHLEVAGALVGLAAHVGGALDVVLSAQGFTPTPGRPMLPVIMAMSAMA
jgi:hypothetical protein